MKHWEMGKLANISINERFTVQPEDRLLSMIVS